MESDRLKDFCVLYGTIQTAVMCLAIACGLPADAGGAKDLRPTVVTFAPNNPSPNICLPH